MEIWRRAQWAICALMIAAVPVRAAGAAVSPAKPAKKASSQAAAREALVELLLATFTSPSDLKSELTFDDRLGPLVPKLPERGASMRQYAGSAVSLFAGRGLIDAAFFELIRKHSPGQAARITQVQQLWPAAAAGRASPRARSKTDALVELLTSLFVEGELQQFVSFHERWSVFEKELPGRGASQAKVAAAVVKQLAARGMIDRSAFESLKSERPGRVADIAAVEKLWAPFPAERATKAGAKAAAPKAASKAPAPAKIAPHASAKAGSCTKLADFFADFRDYEVRRFAFHDERLRAVPGALPSGSASSRKLADALAAAIEKHKLLDAALLQLLTSQVPGRAREIESIFAACGAAPGGPSGKANKTLVLEALLLSLFPSHSDLAQFMHFSERLPALQSLLPHGSTLTVEVDELIRLLMRRGWVDPAFFAALQEERPGRAHDIEAARRAWLGSGKS
jgi:hypothetical protein